MKHLHIHLPPDSSGAIMALLTTLIFKEQEIMANVDTLRQDVATLKGLVEALIAAWKAAVEAGAVPQDLIDTTEATIAEAQAALTPTV